MRKENYPHGSDSLLGLGPSGAGLHPTTRLSYHILSREYVHVALQGLQTKTHNVPPFKFIEHRRREFCQQVFPPKHCY